MCPYHHLNITECFKNNSEKSSVSPHCPLKCTLGWEYLMFIMVPQATMTHFSCLPPFNHGAIADFPSSLIHPCTILLTFNKKYYQHSADLQKKENNFAYPLTSIDPCRSFIWSYHTSTPQSTPPIFSLHPQPSPRFISLLRDRPDMQILYICQELYCMIL